MRLFAITILLVLAGIGRASTPLVLFDGASENGILEINVPAQSGEPINLALRLANNMSGEAPTMLSWQLALSAVPSEGAKGAIIFENAIPHEPPLFGAESDFKVLSGLSTSSTVFQELDLSIAGVSIGENQSAGIAAIQLSHSVDAAGVFILAMLPLDPDDLDHGSFWFNAADFEPTDFANLPDTFGLIELARINVQRATVDGDYNDDLSVDAADYTVWRDGLDSEFLPEHYEIWKQHFGQVITPAVSTGYAVPEPDGWIALGCCFVITVLNRKSRPFAVLVAERVV